MFSGEAAITFKSRREDWAFKAVAFSLRLDGCMFLTNESLYEYAWAYKHYFLKAIFVFWNKIGSIFQVFCEKVSLVSEILWKKCMCACVCACVCVSPPHSCYILKTSLAFFLHPLNFTVSSLSLRQVKWQWLILEFWVGELSGWRAVDTGASNDQHPVLPVWSLWGLWQRSAHI